MATLSKAEFILKKNLEAEGLSLDKAPTLKAIVLKTIDDILNDSKSNVAEKPKQIVDESLHAVRLARCVDSLVSLIGPSNNFAVKEGLNRLQQYKKDHPNEKL